jgi:asparagine synthase (glutamine-hydrolysing)
MQYWSANKMIDKFKMNINIEGLFGKLSTLNDHFFLVGEVFLKKELLAIEAVHKLILKAILDESLESLLLNFSGFYSFVYLNSSQVISAVDRTRSRPLFYSTENNNDYVSDSAYWVVEQLSEKKVNVLAEQELQQAGYVSGEDTLVSELQQIPAGSVLTLTEKKYRLNYYYYYVPSNNNEEVSHTLLHEKLDYAMKKSIAQLINYANGRQLVVPLSGGYDSRAIALYLKELNYNNIITFTFGKVSSEEVAISKQVADALGFKWYFVEYSRGLWRSLTRETVFNNFLDFISSYVSVPNVQVFPAVQKLIEQGVILPDAILVPGHTGDFVSGGHIPKQLLNLPAKGNTLLIVSAIFERHYCIKSKLNKSDALKIKLSKQIEHLQGILPEGLPAASLFEAWEYKERQAKFIVNSNRYYDYFNLDWWMPLWHESVTDFWIEAPLNARVNSTLWQKFIVHKYSQITNTTLVHANVNDKYSARVLRFRGVFDYFTDVNCLHALVPFHRWLLRKLKYPYANGTVFSFLSAKMIKRIKKKIKS